VLRKRVPALSRTQVAPGRAHRGYHLRSLVAQGRVVESRYSPGKNDRCALPLAYLALFQNRSINAQRCRFRRGAESARPPFTPGMGAADRTEGTAQWGGPAMVRVRGSREPAHDGSLSEKDRLRRSFEHGVLGRRWRDLYSSWSEPDPERKKIAKWAQTRLAASLALLDQPLVPKTGLVLEVGCGDGSLARLLAERGYSVIACDISLAMLRAAQKNCQRLIRVDIDHLPLKERSLDLLVCLGVLEYLPNLAATLSECHRVLKRGGVLLLSAANYVTPAYVALYPWRRLAAALALRSSALSRLWATWRQKFTDGVTVRSYNHFKLNKLTQSTGFRRLAWTTHSFEFLGLQHAPALNVPILRRLGNNYVATYIK
jgi:SAM-dependent methyltransferase